MLHLKKMINKLLIIFVLYMTICKSAAGYHNQFLSIINYEQLYPRQAIVAISHRFNGKLFQDEGVFGQKKGANVAYFMRFGLPKLQSIQVFRSNLYDQLTFVYKKSFELKNSSFYGISFSYDQLKLNIKKENSLSSTFFYSYKKDLYNVVLNLIYKDYFSSIQLGTGISYTLFNNSKLLYEVISPVNKYKNKIIHIINLKIMTFGHNFYFFISNQNEVGDIPSSSGADDMTFHSGFKIERIFDF